MARRTPMNLLLDTCALLALAGSVGNLYEAAAEALGKADEVFVSSVSIWEIAIKSASKKLKLSLAPWDWFEVARDRYSLSELPLDARRACAAAALPDIHRDPFDRVLVATALHHRLTLLTYDRTLRQYPGVQTLW